jgi:hypothetical protein
MSPWNPIGKRHIMDIGKLAAPKGNDQNQRVDRTRSKDLASKIAAASGEKPIVVSSADSVEISGNARNMGQVVESFVSQLNDRDGNSPLDAARIQDYRDQLESGALTTPEILQSTASRILQGMDAEIATFPSLEQRGL